MSKTPPNAPIKGDRVTLRGRDQLRIGTLVKWDVESKWCSIAWDDEGGPRMAHLHELVRYAPDEP